MLGRLGLHPRKPRFARAPRPPSERDEVLRSRAEAEAAIAEARKSHERLRQAIEILPQGIVFLDAEGRYVLWNKQYAEIYSKTADLFEEGARLEDTLRIGVARGDYSPRLPATRKTGSPSGCKNSISPARATSRSWRTVASS
ncbi:PAS domain-containing protein [Bradyrhizobium sp. LM4.3]